MAEKILLKDLLFNKEKVSQLADEIKDKYPSFKRNEFIRAATARFSELELKQRISWMAECLRTYLPENYREAVNILLMSLPKPNDPDMTDNDFGDFIYAPYAEFVAKYGCTKTDWQFSLTALREITQRFSAEDAIRYFINAFPNESLAEILKWSTDSHYHVRRLSSEGTRPKLPWAQKITIPIEAALPILDNLFSDKTRFVTRSVANHMNDISKIDPDLVLRTLKKWQTSGKQQAKEMDYIIQHSLRTLIKQGYSPAFAFLQFSDKANVTLSDFTIKNDHIRLGEPLLFSFLLQALADEQMLIDYIIFFQNKNGQMKSKKVFKLKKINMKKDQRLHIQKTHPLREQMTTRTIYPGEHKLEVQINGKIFASAYFTVLEKTA